MQQQNDSKLTANQQQTRSKLTHIKKEKKENKEKKEKKDRIDGTHATRQKRYISIEENE